MPLPLAQFRPRLAPRQARTLNSLADFPQDGETSQKRLFLIYLSLPRGSRSRITKIW